MKREDIKFEIVDVTEDRADLGEGTVCWTDYVWESWRFELGHTVDDREWCITYMGKSFSQPADKRGVCFKTVRSIRKAKDFILDMEG